MKSLKRKTWKNSTTISSAKVKHKRGSRKFLAASFCTLTCFVAITCACIGIGFFDTGEATTSLDTQLCQAETDAQIVDASTKDSEVQLAEEPEFPDTQVITTDETSNLELNKENLESPEILNNTLLADQGYGPIEDINPNYDSSDSEDKDCATEANDNDLLSNIINLCKANLTNLFGTDSADNTNTLDSSHAEDSEVYCDDCDDDCELCTSENGGHKCTHSGYKKWNKKDYLPYKNGNYYLDNDVTITDYWLPPENCTLCLNGHNIISKENGQPVIRVGKCQLTIEDCSSTPGSISHADGKQGNGIAVECNGVLYLNAGKICNNNSGKYSGAGINISTNSLVYMYGGEIYNNVSPDSTYGCGAGVSVGSGCIFRMYGGTIRDNKATTSGGGVFCSDNAQAVSFQNVIIKNNSADYGGGVSAGCATDFKNCQIDYNTANYGGGGLNCNGSTKLSNCTIESNSSSDFAGGMYSKTSADLYNTVIGWNKTKTQGAGVYVKGWFQVDNEGGQLIRNNVSSDGCGGAFYVERNSTLRVLDAGFLYNSATSGGAVFSQGRAEIYKEYASGSLCSMYNNSASNSGGSIFVSETGSLYLDHYKFNINNATNGQGGAICSYGDVSINGCEFLSCYAKAAGGAIYSQTNLGLYEYINYGLTKTKFNENKTDGYGGAIYANNITVYGAIFDSNTATKNGGAIFQEGTGTYSSPQFSKNSSKEGGAIYVSSYSANMTSPTFDSNTANYGSAISAFGPVTIAGTASSYSTITNNISNNTGGAFYGNASASFSFSYCEATGNKANDGYGGVIYSNGNTTVKASNFNNNYASKGGGAIYCQGDLVLSGIDSVWSNFNSNQCGTYGGGAYAGGDNITISNTNINSNTANIGGGVFTSASGNFTSSNISSNSTSGPGGGLYISSDSLNITTCNIDSNKSNKYGGGIACFGTINFTNKGWSSVSNNSSKDDGGGIYNGSDSLSMSKVKLNSNSSESKGGAIFNSKTLTANNLEVKDNIAVYGAGIFNYGTSTISNLSAESNTSSDIGSAIYNYGSLTLNNATIQKNTGKYGVYVGYWTSAFVLGGKCIIKDNIFESSTDESKEINVYLVSSNLINIDSKNPLTSGSSVGVTSEQKGNPIPITEVYSKTASGYFTSDNTYYKTKEESATGDYQTFFYIDSPSHIHCRCGHSQCTEEGHSDITWYGTDVLPTREGNYYLMNDINLTDTWIPTGDTKICLNGHSITKTNTGSSGNATIKVNSGVTLTISECNSSAGMITHTDGVSGLGVLCDGGTLNMYGGAICNNTMTSYYSGAGVYLQNSAIFNLFDGQVSNNKNETNSGYGAGVMCASNSVINMYDGEISNNSSKYYGGGLCLSNGGDSSITGGSISDNKSTSGGGIYCSSTKLLVKNTTISGNTASYLGGGVSIADSKADVTLNNTVVSGNLLGSDSYGGCGIYNNGNLTIIGGAITNNSSTSAYGGGIANNGKLNLADCTISNNSALYGGGIYNAVSSDISNEIVVNGAQITNNDAKYGGGLFNTSSSTLTSKVKINSADITENTATYYGGGIYNNGISTSYSILEIESANIQSNNANSHGGGIYNNSYLTIHGGNILSNTATKLGGGVYDKGASSVFELGGNPTISNNKDTNETQASNILLYDNAEITLSSKTPLQDNTSYGVALYKSSNGYCKGNVSTPNDSDLSNHFVSEYKLAAVANGDDNRVILGELPPVCELYKSEVSESTKIGEYNKINLAITEANKTTTTSSEIFIIKMIRDYEPNEITNFMRATSSVAHKFVLDLNNKNISGVSVPKYSTVNSSIFVGNKVELTITDSSQEALGSITQSSGGAIDNCGTLNLEGGIISNNTSENGAGIFNENIFNMTGGTITNNECSGKGSAIYNTYVMSLTGGSITENTGQYGVFSEGSYTPVSVGGNIQVSNNIYNDSESSKASNVVLSKGQLLTISNDIPFVDGVSIGIQSLDSANPVNVSYDYDNDVDASSAFVSDDELRSVYNRDTGSSQHCVALHSSYFVKFDAQGKCNNPTTISAYPGDTITEPTGVTSSGLSLVGWFKDEALTDEWNFDTDTISDNITLYAKWMPAVSVANLEYKAPENLKYDAKEKQASVTLKEGITPSEVGEITVKYYTSTGELVDGAPVDVGTYQVKVDVEGTEYYGKLEDLTDDSWVFTITAREVTITTEGASKIYDRTPLTNSAYSVSGDSFIEEEKPLISNTGACTEVGSVDNTCQLIWPKDEYSDNYAITYVYGQLTLTRKAVTLVADNKFKVAGEDDPELTATPDGAVDSYEFTYDISRVEGEDIGSYTISVTGEEEQGNYTVSYKTGTLKIVSEPYYVNFDTNGGPEIEVQQQKICDGQKVEDPGEVTSGNQMVSGWYKEAACANKWDFDADTPTGNMTLYAKWKNYTSASDFKYEATSNEFTYDGKTHSATVTPKEGVGAITYQYKCEDGTLLTTDPVDAGVYTIVVSVEESETYCAQGSISNSEWKLTINKRSLTVTSTGKTKTYDSEPLTCSQFKADGLQNGEIINLVYTGTQTDVGSSENTFEIKWAEDTQQSTAKSSNYDTKSAYGTLEVKQAKIKVETESTPEASIPEYNGYAQGIKAAKMYVLKDDGSTWAGPFANNSDNIVKLFNKDSESLTLATTGKQIAVGSTPNTYQVTFNKDAKESNYVVDSTLETLGTVKVQQKALTVTTDSWTGEYDAKTHTADGKIEGLADGETLSLITKGEQKTVGEAENTYELVWDGTARDTNYKVGTENIGKITVNPCSVVITADNVIAKTGTACPASFTATITYPNAEDGKKPDDKYTITHDAPTTDAPNPLVDGTYPITVTGAALQGEDNYSVTYVEGTLTATSVVYNFTYNFNGHGGDTETVQVLENAKAASKTPAEVTGWDFGGWYTDDGTFTNPWDFDKNIVTEPTTVYAKWTRNYVDSKLYVGTNEQGIGGDSYTQVGSQNQAVYSSALDNFVKSEATSQTVSFKNESIALARPYTGDDDEKAKSNVKFESYGTGLSFGNTTLTTSDVSLKTVTFNDSIVLKYKKYTNDGKGYVDSFEQKDITTGTWAYSTTTSQSPSLELYASADGTSWTKYADATFDTEGKMTITPESGTSATVEGSTVTLPDGLLYYKVTSTFKSDGLLLNTSSTMQINATETVKGYVENLYKSMDSPSATFCQNSESKLTKVDETSKTSTSLNVQGACCLKGINYGIDSKCELTYTNDETNKLFNVHVDEKAVLQSTITSQSAYNECLDSGSINKESSGTFWTLLPAGVDLDTRKIEVSGGTSCVIKSAEKFSNFKDTGRTMVKIEVSLNPTPVNISYVDSAFGKSGYAQVPQISFDFTYSWDDVQERTENLDVIFAYESSNSDVGTMQNHTGEPDNPLAGKNTSSINAVNGYEDVFTGLDSTRSDAYSFVYGRITKQITEKISANPGLSMSACPAGGTYSQNAEAEALSSYTYKTRLEATDTQQTGIVFYDAIEQAGTTNGTWRGRLCSVDTSQLQQAGCAPVVYYSTKVGIVLNNASSQDLDLTNKEVWSTTPPTDLSTVTGVAVDATKDINGGDFVVAPYKACSYRLRMAAPAWTEGMGSAINQASAMYGDVGGSSKFYTSEVTNVACKERNVIAKIDWDDSGDVDGKRPESVLATLYVNGTATTITTTLNDANNWQEDLSQKIADARILLVDEEGNDAQLAIKAADISDYTSTSTCSSKDNNTVVAINNYHAPRKINISGVVEWDDEYNAAGKRPDSVIIRLLKKYSDGTTSYVDHEKIYQNADGTWTFNFGAKNFYENKGTEVSYVIEQNYKYGYTTKVVDVFDTEKTKQTFTVTNTYSPYGCIEISIPRAEGATDISAAKKITLYFDIYSSSYAVADTGDIEYNIVKDGAIIDSGILRNRYLVDVPQGCSIVLPSAPSEYYYCINCMNREGFKLLSEESIFRIGVEAGKTYKREFKLGYEASGSGKLTITLTNPIRMVEGSGSYYGVDLYDSNKAFLEHKDFDTIYLDGKKADAYFDAYYSLADCGTTGIGTVTYYYREVVPDDAVNADGKKYSEASEEEKELGGFSKNGVVFNSQLNQFVVTVKDDASGGINLLTNSAEIIHGYTASGSFAPYGFVSLSGATLAADQFMFELKDVETGAFYNAKNDADGKFTFDELKYDFEDAGDHKFKLTQCIPNSDKIEIDDSEFDITLTVYDGGYGKLYFNMAVQDSSGKFTAPSFFNRAFSNLYISMTFNTTISGEFKYKIKVEDEASNPITGEYSTQFNVEQWDLAKNNNDSGNILDNNKGEFLHADNELFSDEANGDTITFDDKGVSYFRCDMSSGIGGFGIYNLPAGARYSIIEETLPAGVFCTYKNGETGIIEYPGGSGASFKYGNSSSSTNFTPTAHVGVKYKEETVALSGDENFQFQISGGNLTTPMTCIAGANGDAAFPLLTFNSADTYNFTIEQLDRKIEGEETTYNIDKTTKYKLTVKVVSSGSGLTVESATYQKEGEETTSDTASFTNTLKDAPVVKQGDLTISETLNPAGFESENKKFKYKVTLMYPDKTSTIENVEITTNSPKTYEELPEGTKWSIEEVVSDRPAGYNIASTSTTMQSGTITNGVEDKAEFTHAYSQSPTKVKLNAQKKLYGASLQAGDYSFTLNKCNETSEPGEEIYSATNAADGSLYFNTPDLSTAGTYNYYICETVPDDAVKTIDGVVTTFERASFAQKSQGGFVKNGVSYGAPYVKVVVTTTDKGDGTLSSSVKYGDDESTTSAVFTNEVYPGSLQVSLIASGQSAKSQENELGAKLTLTRPDGRALTGSISWTKSDINADGSVSQNDIETGTSELTSGSCELNSVAGKCFVINNLPAGTLWSVEQGTTPDGYIFASGAPASGEVSANDYAGQGSASLNWTYTTTGSWAPTATKTIDGGKPASGEFSFQLVNKSTGVAASTATCDKDGKVTFSSITYSAANHGDTYTYIMSEVNGGRSDVEYDATEYEIEVVVVDNGDGKMKVTATSEASAFTFANETIQTGDLSIENKVNPATGVSAIPSQSGTAPFGYEIALTDSSGATLAGPYSWTSSDGRSGTITSTENKIYTTAGGNVRITGLPDGSKYTVKPYGNLPAGYSNTQPESSDGSIVALNISRATFTNDYKPLSVTLDADKFVNATKEIDGEWPEAYKKTFSIELSAENGAPMPESATEGKLTKTIDGEGSTTFGSVTYDAVGEYKYTVKEVAGTYKGYTFDTTTYTVTYKVVDEYGQLKATPTITSSSSSEAVTEVVFTNKYAITQPAESWFPSVSNTVEGQSAPQHTFSFVLQPQGDCPLPPTPKSESSVVDITGTGTAKFGTDKTGQIFFNKAGTYKYTISEVNDGTSGYTFDSTVYDLVYTVVDKDSELSATYELTKQGGEEIKTLKSSSNNNYSDSTYSTLNGAGTYQSNNESDVDDASFKNKYALPVDATVPSVTKTVTGLKRQKDYTFSFELSRNDATCPMPANTKGDVASAQITIAKDATTPITGTFANIEFSKAGTFSYIIKEVAGSDPFIYDSNSYLLTYTVTLSNDETKYEATPSITKIGEPTTTITSFDFVNEYNPVKHKVTYNTLGGSTIESVDVEVGTLVPRPAEDPTRAGYTFGNWYKDNPCTQLWLFDTDKMPDNDLTIYASWNARTDTKYTVEHYKTDASGTPQSTPFATQVLSGTTGQDTNAVAQEVLGYSLAEKITQLPIAGDGSTVVKVNYKPNTNTKYTVRHWKLNESGQRVGSPADTDNMTGTTDTLTSAVAKTYDGYTVKAYEQKKIEADGSTIVDIEYAIKPVEPEPEPTPTPVPDTDEQINETTSKSAKTGDDTIAYAFGCFVVAIAGLGSARLIRRSH